MTRMTMLGLGLATRCVLDFHRKLRKAEMSRLLDLAIRLAEAPNFAFTEVKFY
jgi:hypothetical protein